MFTFIYDGTTKGAAASSDQTHAYTHTRPSAAFNNGDAGHTSMLDGAGQQWVWGDS